jgi:Family of unknown function (DUF6090)
LGEKGRYNDPQNTPQYFSLFSFKNLKMEDKTTKNTKEILSISKEKKGAFKEKIGKISLEVVIIVFSIMVSLWLDNWNDKRKEREEVKEFLADLKEDLKEDTISMHSKINKLKPYIKDYSSVLDLTDTQLDSMKKVNASVNLNFDFIPFQLNEGSYQGFKSSGKIGFIDNKNLKREILSYHEQLIPSLKEIEKIHMEHQKVLMNTFFGSEYSEKSTKETFLDPSVRAQLNTAKMFANLMVQFSETSLQQADSLLLAINKELK